MIITHKGNTLLTALMQKRDCVHCVCVYRPFPMPLTTAPSLTPDVLALLDGALCGARLGKNKQLERDERTTNKNESLQFPQARHFAHFILASR